VTLAPPALDVVDVPPPADVVLEVVELLDPPGPLALLVVVADAPPPPPVDVPASKSFPPHRSVESDNTMAPSGTSRKTGFMIGRL
jgi:hypothetical protein